MRISDWSSDVCSSDLLVHRVHQMLRMIERALPECFARVGRDEVILERIARRHRAHREQDQRDQDRQRAFVRPIATRSRHILVAVRAIAVMLIVQRMLRSAEHTSELQSLMRISYAVFCLKKKNKI